MKIVIAIFVIFCAYPYAASKETANCMHGVKSMSMVLYTREIPYGKNIGIDVPCDAFDPSKPIAVVVHGFIITANHSIFYSLSKSLLEKDFTVLSMDWSEAACTFLIPFFRLAAYPFAVHNTRKVGQLMAKYVISLIDKCGVSLNNMTFVGHSLGAHVCGFAAKEIQKLGYGTVPRIFGADPAQPGFRFKRCKDRLCDTDAITTIMLHTTHSLGMQKPIGSIDLYFDGGSSQGGCNFFDVTCRHFNALSYLTIAAETCTCRFPGVAVSYPKITFKFSEPSYPQENTTDCFVIDCTIFNNDKEFDKFKGKSYYVFVDPDTFCSFQNFSCQD